MKTGLILEGGAMRGMFTCGVIDVMMEHNITYDGGIGVSAGAVFGCNYKSNQIGRGIRYNKRFCRDKRYCSLRSLITTGNLYNEQFCYHTLPDELDIFDTKAYQENAMEFYAVCTDVKTGKPVYHNCKDGLEEDIQWFRASASLPLVSRVVKIGDYHLLDGGIADSIPLSYFESIGYDRNVVVLTRPSGYVKEKTSHLPLAKLLLRKYPNMVHAMENRHIHYNETLRLIESKEKNGEIFVIRPPEPLNIGATERDPKELERVYQIGRTEAQKHLEELRKYLSIQ